MQNVVVVSTNDDVNHTFDQQRRQYLFQCPKYTDHHKPQKMQSILLQQQMNQALQRRLRLSCGQWFCVYHGVSMKNEGKTSYQYD